jgi:hypothetical protein
LTKYIEKSFSLRVHKRDGTAKLVAGVTGGVKIGKVVKIPVAKHGVLVAKITAPPRALDEPWEATQVGFLAG